jgi:hypothetical protein
MIVPPLAALVFRNAGWRVAFLITACAGLVWIPLWIAVTRSPAVRAQLDAATGPAVPRPAFRELIAHPIVLRALVAIFAVAPVFAFPQTWGAKYLVRAFAVKQGDVGDYLWLPPLVFDVVAIVIGDRASRQRRAEGAPPRMLFAIGATLAVTLAALPLATTPWQSVIILGAAMAGSGAVYALVTADLLARMPAGSVSFAGGILAGAQSLALIIANPLIGRAVDRIGNYDGVALVLAAWVVPGSLIWLRWRPPVRFIPRG